MKKPDATFATPSLRDGADSTDPHQGEQLLAVLERIACALEKQNEAVPNLSAAIEGIANRVEDLVGLVGMKI